jgi:hypothetical protein
MWETVYDNVLYFLSVSRHQNFNYRNTPHSFLRPGCSTAGNNYSEAVKGGENTYDIVLRPGSFVFSWTDFLRKKLIMPKMRVVGIYDLVGEGEGGGAAFRKVLMALRR